MTKTSQLSPPWYWLPIVAGALFSILAMAAAIRETPTVDEFAHVPAGVVHWRHGQLNLYRNNPPLGKMWIAARYGAGPIKLMYFGHARPELYGIQYQLPALPPELAIYVVSTNYWKGMLYAHLNAQGLPEYRHEATNWMKYLVPTEQDGSLMIFDLRESTHSSDRSPRNDYNMAVLLLRSGDPTAAITLLNRVIQQEPQWAEASYFLGFAYNMQGQSAQAIASYRKALELKPEWDEPLNNLAWLLATATDPALRNGQEAPRLATQLNERQTRPNAACLDTLAAALAETGDFTTAQAICRQGLDLAQKAKDESLVEALSRALQHYEQGQPLRE